MNVLHVIPGVASRYGGPSHAIIQICAELLNGGIKTVIATTNANGDSVLPVPLGKIQNYEDIPTIFFQRNFSEAFKYSHRLADWLMVNVANYDLVHIHAVFSHACLSAARACRHHSIPYIVRTIGNLDPWSLAQKPLRKKLFWHSGVKQMLRGAAAIHYTSLAEQQLAESALGLQRGVVIPLGVDEALLQPSSAKNPFLDQYPSLRNSPYVLTLCRLHPKKNLETLIELFVRLSNQPALSGWKFVIAGKGEPGYAEHLQSVVKAAGGERQVLFVGWLQGEQKRGALRGASLFALPSHQENFGLSVVEAMACGVPVLISQGVNLADEVFAASAGWIVSFDQLEIETALHTAMNGAAERALRGQAARELVRQQYRWAAVGEQLAQLYEQICGQR